MNYQQLQFGIEVFENRIKELEKQYKKKHAEDFHKKKMYAYIKRKNKNEREFLIAMNLNPSVQILEDSDRFKY